MISECGKYNVTTGLTFCENGGNPCLDCYAATSDVNDNTDGSQVDESGKCKTCKSIQTVDIVEYL